ncbi:MAG: SH3 domain-containing protein [Pseudomonadota bacterium]
MTRFMLVTFLFLGWGFFELSGGTDFEPPEMAETQLNDLQKVAVLQADAQVARAASTPAAIAPQINTPDATPEPTLASFGGAGTGLATVLGEAAAALEPEVEQEVVATLDLREVTGNRVNMRNGPGTNFQVLTQLNRGDGAEVLQAPGNGWVKIRVVQNGRVGWMAERLLTPQG